ncbi:MAG: class II aldolase/adducin family protein [Gallionella sp.]|nr:class II aldolase/adducin family protein [Gallionella sp.]MDD4946687.1 class II aldolase/adducin family protein [Gallionella sp.]
MNEQALRAELVRFTQELDAQGFSHGTAGNLSARHGAGFLITPSGFGAEGLTEDDIVFVEMSGRAHGRWQPSSEWLFHRDIYAQRPEFGAVIHTHSNAATALACLRRDIPPFHYMLALLGGDSLRCAAYATFGTQALSENALLAMRERRACLLANHGMIAAGNNLADAYRNTVEVENLSELYLRALVVGEPVLLTPAEFADAQRQFVGYGKPKE